MIRYSGYQHTKSRTVLIMFLYFYCLFPLALKIHFRVYSVTTFSIIVFIYLLFYFVLLDNLFIYHFCLAKIASTVYGRKNNFLQVKRTFDLREKIIYITMSKCNDEHRDE